MAALVSVRRSAGLVLAPEDGVGVAARAAVRFHLRNFSAQQAGARAGEVEAVHQLRVATRRLRATVRLLGPVLPAGFVRVAERELAWLGGAIGTVRDLDVLTQTVHAHAGRLDPDSRRALGPLALVLHDERAARHAALVAALDTARCRRLLAHLVAFADSPPPARQRPLGATAAELVRPLLRAVLRSGRRVTARSEPATLHRVRVRAKRLRYALETLRGLGGRSLPKMVRRLGDLQELLGAGQDMVVAIGWLRAHVEPARLATDTVLAAGGLVEVLARRARKLRRRYPAVWEELDRRRMWGSVMTELSAAAPPRSQAAEPLGRTGS